MESTCTLSVLYVALPQMYPIADADRKGQVSMQPEAMKDCASISVYSLGSAKLELSRAPATE